MTGALQSLSTNHYVMDFYSLQKLAHGITEIFSAVQAENFDIYHIFAQNIECGYKLEPPHPELPLRVLMSTYNLGF